MSGAEPRLSRVQIALTDQYVALPVQPDSEVSLRRGGAVGGERGEMGVRLARRIQRRVQRALPRQRH